MTVVLDCAPPETMRRRTGDRADVASAADRLAGLAH